MHEKPQETIFKKTITLYMQDVEIMMSVIRENQSLNHIPKNEGC